MIHKLLPTSVRATVFDAVGTLIHPNPPAPIVYAEVGRRFGSRRTAAEILPRFVTAFAAEEAVDIANGLQTSEAREIKRWRRIVAQVLDDCTDGDACFHALFEHFRQPESWRCDPTAATTIQTLSHHGYALALASNYDQRLRTVAGGLAPLQLLRSLIISSEVGWRKPAPQFFQAVCQALSLPPGAIVYVGDDPANDIEGARAAGLHAVLVDPTGKYRDHQAPSIRALSELKMSVVV